MSYESYSFTPMKNLLSLIYPYEKSIEPIYRVSQALLYCSRVGLDGYINKKKSSNILELFVGAEGFEPPTLCL